MTEENLNEYVLKRLSEMGYLLDTTTYYLVSDTISIAKEYLRENSKQFTFFWGGRDE